MTDQWGGPQQPQQQPPQDGSGQQYPGSGPGPAPAPGPRSPYGETQGPYYLPPQGGYGQLPPPPIPQQPITPDNPYGQPPMPFGQFPGQQPYGYPPPGRGFQAPNGNRKAMVLGGAVLLVILVAGGIFLATRGSSGGGGRTEAQSCASWQNEQTTLNDQDPVDAAGIVSVLNTDVPVMQSIADSAAPGVFKTRMQQTATDFGAFKSYLVANPDVDLSGDTDPPPQLTRIIDSINEDVGTMDSTCGLPSSDATGGGSGF